MRTYRFYQEDADALTRQHNESQLDALKELEGRCAWYIGEKLGYDPTTTEEGKRLIREEMNTVILCGMGAWLAMKGQE